MKLLTSRNTYAASNNRLEINNGKPFAWSYNWWQYVATDSVGNVFFNDSKYSNSTSNHQSDTATVLRRLGIRIDWTIHNTTAPLGPRWGEADDASIKRCLDASISAYRETIRELICAIRRKGSRKRVNAERRETIRATWYAIKDARRIRDEYVGKKRIPHKRESLASMLKPNEWSPSCLGLSRLSVKRVNSFKRYFRKANGKVQRNEWTAFLNTVQHWSNAPKSIDRIKTLLGLKATDSIEPILLYEYSGDLNSMIPDVDSADYKLLMAYCSRMNITKATLTPLNLDKLHTYLTNKVNRRSYEPKEPTRLSLHPAIAALDGHKDVKLIKTDQDLRREGREQHHCIGSTTYLNRVLRGYQALRFRGYTFFLSPSCEIIETSGRHNSWTPDFVRLELETLISMNKGA